MHKILIAIFLIATLLSAFAVVQPAQAQVGLWEIPLAIGIGLLAGAIIGWYIANMMQTVALEDTVGAQYVNATAIDFSNLIAQATAHYQDEASMLPPLYYYYARKAEYAAQYYVNESTFPYDKVWSYSGLNTELSTLKANITQELAAIDALAKGFAESTYVGDLADYTVIASEQLKTLPYGTDLKTASDTVAPSVIFDTYGALNTSWLTWTLGSCSVATSNDAEGIASSTIKNAIYSNMTALSATMTVLNNSDIRVSTLLDFDPDGYSTSYSFNYSLCYPNGTVFASAPLTSYSGTTEHLVDYSETLNVGNNNLVKVYFGMLRSNNVNPTYTYIFPATLNISQTDQNDHFYPAIIGDEASKVVQAYDFVNSNTHSLIKRVDIRPLVASVSQFIDTLKGVCQQAMQSASAYHTYLRALGYTDVSQIPTLIPTVDLLFPPTNATLWSSTTSGLNATEYYAILAAYMQSLANLMNSPIANNITEVTFNDINFTNLPVYCEGYLYDNHLNVSSGFCNTIWLTPLNHALILTANQNNTFDQDIQAVYQNNSTRTITYRVYHTLDSVYPTAIYTTDQNGVTHNVTTATIGITTLNRYAVDYITGYEGIDIGTTTNWSSLLMVLLVPLMIIMMVMNIFDKRRR